jgi:hypothetical protein
MDVPDQIEEYITSQPEPKRSEMQQLHDLILGVSPGCKLWFLDGKNSEGKVVSNPDIGYGSRDHKYADGTVSEFYQIGLSQVHLSRACGLNPKLSDALLSKKLRTGKTSRRCRPSRPFC